MRTAIAYLGLGSNLGDRKTNMRAAVDLLRERRSCCVTRVSSLYSTEPVGVENQPEFLNAVVELSTALSPDRLLRACLDIERKLGRKRTFQWGPRVIDVDVLLYGALSMKDRDLVIPHPRLVERGFVLVPLAEIAPEVDIGGGMTAARGAEIVGGKGVRRIADSEWAD